MPPIDPSIPSGSGPYGPPSGPRHRSGSGSGSGSGGYGGGSGRSGGGGGRGRGKPEFSGPILSGQVQVPSRRERNKARKHRRRPGQRILKGLVIFLAIVVVIAGIGYGYFRYEWSQVKTAPCANCSQVADGAPYNVLVIGSDTRVGETAAEAQQFGNQSTAGGQRADTIKIVHVDPQAGTASTLSIPRDTFVTLSGVPASSGVSTKNKINAAFASGPNDPNPVGTGANGLVTTIENTFGIPITHWIAVNFFGLMDAVNGLHGIKMNVPYPVRDYGDCNMNGVYSNCTGLDIQSTGCQVLTGAEALSLSRSRHFEWYQDGEWQSDGSGDLGRIQRQDLIIEAVVNKAKSTYNPITAASFISSLTHDVTLDSKLGPTALLSLAERYHAFSGSSLQNFTIPTTGASYAPYGGESVEVVDESKAPAVISQFLGGPPDPAPTPPLDAYGEPSTIPPTTTTTAPPTTTTSRSTATTRPTTTPTTAAPAVPSYDPTPC